MAYPQPEKPCNRVWIELEQPASAEHGAEIARAANRMLYRLGDGTERQDTFWWSQKDHRFCYGGPMGYHVCSDNGWWFNLDYLGRP